MANVPPSVLESYFLLSYNYIVQLAVTISCTSATCCHFLLSLLIYGAHFCSKGCTGGLLVYRKDVVGGASQNLDMRMLMRKVPTKSA